MHHMSEKAARTAVNRELASLPIYSTGLQLGAIDDILLDHGFKGLEPGVYCGREGRINEQVGPKTWLCLSWFKMEVSGKFEVTAYVS